MRKQDAVEILEEVKLLDDSMYQYDSNYLDALNVAIESLKTEAIPIKWIREFLGEISDAIENNGLSNEVIRYLSETYDAIIVLLYAWAERKDEEGEE